MAKSKSTAKSATKRKSISLTGPERDAAYRAGAEAKKQLAAIAGIVFNSLGMKPGKILVGTVRLHNDTWCFKGGGGCGCYDSGRGVCRPCKKEEELGAEHIV